ncbi:TonB family protein [Devosia sp. CN2-171]|uniref:energy transducer TonB family protein n=1 Tax=Devosia sp. CN2-171 TaxID=3400909 RepID=UPI003BF7D11C
MRKAMAASALIHLGLIAGAWAALNMPPVVDEADAESVSVSVISMDMVSTEPSEVVTQTNRNLVSAGEDHEAMDVPEVVEAQQVTADVAETADIALPKKVAEAEQEVAAAPAAAETSETDELVSAVVLTAATETRQPIAAAIPQVTSEAATIVVDTVKPSRSDPLEQLRTASISELTPPEPVQKLPETLAKPVEAIKPVQEANLSPTIAEVEETAEAVPVPLPRIVRKPVEEPAEPKQAEPKPKEQSKKKAEPSKKPAEAKPQKQAPSKQANLGNGGNAEADAAASSKSGGGKGKKDNGGSAAASKYPGLVQAKVTRAARYPAKAKGKDGEALVSFVVGSGGNVSKVALARSSGNGVLDDAAVAAVNRAAPFPPIPEAAGRSSWAFTVPVYFKK